MFVCSSIYIYTYLHVCPNPATCHLLFVLLSKSHSQCRPRFYKKDVLNHVSQPLKSELNHPRKKQITEQPQHRGQTECQPSSFEAKISTHEENAK